LGGFKSQKSQISSQFFPISFNPYVTGLTEQGLGVPVAQGRIAGTWPAAAELQVYVYRRLCTTAYSSTPYVLLSNVLLLCASSRERHVWALGSGLVEGRARSGLDLGGGAIHQRPHTAQRSAAHSVTGTHGPEKRSFLLLLYPGAAQERPSNRTPGVVVVFLPFPSHLLI
jgi:hypothetical protein